MLLKISASPSLQGHNSFEFEQARRVDKTQLLSAKMVSINCGAGYASRAGASVFKAVQSVLSKDRKRRSTIALAMSNLTCFWCSGQSFAFLPTPLHELFFMSTKSTCLPNSAWRQPVHLHYPFLLCLHISNLYRAVRHLFEWVYTCNVSFVIPSAVETVYRSPFSFRKSPLDGFNNAAFEGTGSRSGCPAPQEGSRPLQ